MLNSKNIGNGVVVEDSIDFVPKAVCERLPRYILKKGDILFGRAGTIERHTYVDTMAVFKVQIVLELDVKISKNHYIFHIIYG